MITPPVTLITHGIVAVAAAAAWAWQGNSCGRELADLRTTHAQANLRAAHDAATAVQQAQVRGDALTDALAKAQVQIDQLAQDKRDALHRLTTGRACLSGAAVRVLNADPAAPTAPSLPPATGGTAATGAAFATDTDIGGWAIATRAQYATCRDRLAALIDWHTTAPAEQHREP